MSKYSTTESQTPFKPAFSTNKVILEAKINNKTSEITEFKAGLKGKRLKTFPVRKGNFLSTFKEVESYLEKALNADKKGQK